MAIFAQFFELKGEPKITFSCDAMGGIYFRDLLPDKVTRGWHCPPVQQPYFNTVSKYENIADNVIKAMADHAYEAVVVKMPKYIQKELRKT